MICMKCNKDLLHCTCADLADRLKKAADHPNVHITKCDDCGEPVYVCKCIKADPAPARVTFRIAIRSDEEWVTAWFAPVDSMEGAFELSRFRKTSLTNAGGTNGKAFQLWQESLREACSAAATACGADPGTWEIKEPPEKRG